MKQPARAGRLSDKELLDFLAVINGHRSKHNLSVTQITTRTGLWSGYFIGDVWTSKRRPTFATVDRVLAKLGIKPVNFEVPKFNPAHEQFRTLMRRYVSAKAAGFGYWFPAVGAIVTWALQQMWGPDFPITMQLYGDINQGMSPAILFFPCDGGVEVRMKFSTAHDSLDIEVVVMQGGAVIQSSAVRPLTQGMVRDVMSYVTKIRRTASRGGPGYPDIGELEKAFDATYRQDQQTFGSDT